MITHCTFNEVRVFALTSFFSLKSKQMKIEIASRKRAKIRLSIQGPSGSGKTYGALLIAKGLVGDLRKVCVIDTENSSAELYAHLGRFHTIQLAAPFAPEKFTEAIHLCEASGIEVIVIDSASHEWDGVGGILDIHASIPGNSFTAWSKVTPRHNQFIQTMLHCNAHVITTIRSKQEYVLSDKNGKQVPEKVGMKGIQRDGYEYDSTIAFELLHNHQVIVGKDRTGLFTSKHDLVLSPEVGIAIADWCAEGDESLQESVESRISQCKSIQELLELYMNSKSHQQMLKHLFEQRKKELINGTGQSNVSPVNVQENATITHQI